MAPEFHHIIPILRIFDIAKAREFYVDFLGFTVEWEHRFDAESPVYMAVRRGNLVLHLSEHYGDAAPGSNVFIDMEGIEAFHRELIGKKYRYLRPGLGPASWGGLCMETIDPFGNRLRFSERMPEPR